MRWAWTAWLGCYGLWIGVASLGAIGCGATADTDPGAPLGPSGGGPSGGGPSGGGPSGGAGGSNERRVVVGCRVTPLELGPVMSAGEAAVQIVWTGSEFAVSWVAPGGYEIRITDGASISNALTLPAMPEGAEPQLFWTGSELALYYALEESVYVDTIGDVKRALGVVGTELVGMGPRFRAVMMDDRNVAVVTDDALFVGGRSVETRVYFVGNIGWNGEYFLYSSPLGHGAWNLRGLNLDGSAVISTLMLQWSGIDGTGRGAGSSFASSAVSGRHALAVAASGNLTFVVEGSPTFERAILEADADASVFWDGQHYLVLLANGPVLEGVGRRDVSLLAFSEDGTLVSDTGTPAVISDHVADERFPVGVAAGDNAFGAAWIQDGAVVVQRCSVVFR